MQQTGAFPASKQRPGTFPFIAQQQPKPLWPGDRPVTARENYLLNLKGELPWWIPIWTVDNQYCWPDVVWEHAAYEYDGLDWWGQEWVFVPEANGQVTKPGCHILKDVTRWKTDVRFPDLDKVAFEEDGRLQTARYDPDRPHVFQCAAGMWERLHELMGFDEALVSLCMEPDSVKEFFTALIDYKKDLLGRMFKFYDPLDYIIYGDDWGTQRAGFFSNAMYRDLIMPGAKAVWEYVHSRGKYVELHSCGLTQQYIEEFIEMGLDAWTPQAINDLDMLTEKYGRYLTLTMGIPNINKAQTERQVRDTVRAFVEKYAPRGHRIVALPFRLPEEKLQRTALEALYEYSSEYYAELRRNQ